MSTTSLINVLCTDEHSIGALSLSLSPVCRIATHDADCKCFCDVLGHRKELRHGLERFSPVILVETGDYHPLSLIRQRFTYFHQVGFEELPFVDAHDLRIFALFKDLRSIVNYD